MRGEEGGVGGDGGGLPLRFDDAVEAGQRQRSIVVVLLYTFTNAVGRRNLRKRCAVATKGHDYAGSREVWVARARGIHCRPIRSGGPKALGSHRVDGVCVFFGPILERPGGFKRGLCVTMERWGPPQI